MLQCIIKDCCCDLSVSYFVGDCHADSLWCLQDVNSHSFLVRLYYQKRVFMGFCCVSCEVLYLMVSLSGLEGSV